MDTIQDCGNISSTRPACTVETVRLQKTGPDVAHIHENAVHNYVHNNGSDRGRSVRYGPKDKLRVLSG